MKRLQNIKELKTALIGFALAALFGVSGFLALQNNPSRFAAAAVVESVNAPADNAKAAVGTEDAIHGEYARDAADTPIVENRMSEEADEAASTAIRGGEASFYGRGFAGRPTANGETFNPTEMTAAHRTLPFGSKVRVTNTNNGRSIVVRVNDRGPFAHNRVIDLSQGAAEQIGMIQSGTAHVKLELIS